jgi:signal peptidase I
MNTIRKIFRFLIRFTFLPFILYCEAIKPFTPFRLLFSGQIKSYFSRKYFNLRSIGRTIFVTILLVPLCLIWLGGHVLFILALLFFLGVINLPHQIVGNSMKPTFNDQETVKMNPFTPFQKIFNKPGRDDIIIFSSEKTNREEQNAEFIKRIVGVPGDEIEIKEGFLFINGQLVNEQYLFKPRSTFGGAFLKECQKIKIPEGQYFVLGDNRKRSEDSRDIGLVSIQEINSILSFDKQKSYSSRWTLIDGVNNQIGLPTFDSKIYYERLNELRVDKGLKPLKINPKLEEAARLRAETIIKYNELGKDSKDSKFNFEQALAKVGYYNTTKGEISGAGYFDEEELLNYWIEFPTKSSIYSKEFQETGIASVIGKINGCETQAIVQEFGAYVPPNYKKADIESWRTTLNRLREILPSWENIRNYSTTYNLNKQDADRLIQIIQLRIVRIDKIVSKMESNKWLTTEENNWTYEDEKLYNEQEAISIRLNNQVWK